MREWEYLLREWGLVNGLLLSVHSFSNVDKTLAH